MRTTVAVVQAGTEGTDTEATLAKAESLIAECGRRGVKVAVFPEAFIGGYPKGADFQIVVGMRHPATRDEFLGYHSRAIVMPGPETDRLGAAARDVNGHYSRPDLFSLSVNQDPSVVSASTAHEEPAR